MQYRTFGPTGWQVSENAFGGWQIAGGWGTIDDTVRTLHHALDAGINSVDAAESYARGRRHHDPAGRLAR